MRPWGESGSAGVRCPRWGREAPGRGGTRWCEAPVSPQGGGAWGYCANHIRLAESVRAGGMPSLQSVTVSSADASPAMAAVQDALDARREREP